MGEMVEEVYLKLTGRSLKRMKIRKAFRVWQRNLTVYTKLYKSSIAFNFVEPVLYLVAIGLGLGGLVKEITGMPALNSLLRD